MYYVYLLQLNGSIKKFYIGSTPNIRRRILQHKEGKVISTKGFLPVKLIYFECYPDKESALEREKKLKKGRSSFVGLLKRLKLR